jgi:putative ABC transport system ATP-binding protein
MRVIETRNVSMIFDSAAEVKALSDISLSFDRGEFAIIKGPSGSGKTTLLSILGCLLSPTSGVVTILGNRTADLSRKELRSLRLRRIGFVFQSFNLLEALTVKENVAIVTQLGSMPKSAGPRDSDVLLEHVGLEHRKDFLPRDCSQGEKQRVAIARAFMNDPDIIIADEPTANLDSKTGQHIIKMIRDLGTTKTVIIATHDERITQMADTVIELEDGKIAATV